MNNFTIREYSDFGMIPQDETRILFESDDLQEVIDYIKDYFKYETYFNAVYFTDNKLTKSGYVGRKLTISLGEDLFEFCGLKAPKRQESNKLSKQIANLQDLKTAFIAHSRGLGSAEDYIKVCENKFNIIEQALIKAEEEHKVLEIIKEKGCIALDVDYENYDEWKKHHIAFMDVDTGEFPLTKEEYNLLKEILIGE